MRSVSYQVWLMLIGRVWLPHITYVDLVGFWFVGFEANRCHMVDGCNFATTDWSMVAILQPSTAMNENDNILPSHFHLWPILHDVCMFRALATAVKSSIRVGCLVRSGCHPEVWESGDVNFLVFEHFYNFHGIFFKLFLADQVPGPKEHWVGNIEAWVGSIEN